MITHDEQDLRHANEHSFLNSHQRKQLAPFQKKSLDRMAINNESVVKSWVASLRDRFVVFALEGRYRTRNYSCYYRSDRGGFLFSFFSFLLTKYDLGCPGSPRSDTHALPSVLQKSCITLHNIHGLWKSHAGRGC